MQAESVSASNCLLLVLLFVWLAIRNVSEKGNISKHFIAKCSTLFTTLLCTKIYNLYFTACIFAILYYHCDEK